MESISRPCKRGQAEDGGFFDQDTKESASAGVRVAIEFCGNALPEGTCRPR